MIEFIEPYLGLIIAGAVYFIILGVANLKKAKSE